MRERLISLELTPQEVLLNSQALCLASWISQSDEGTNPMVESAMRNIRANSKEWVEYLVKMHNVAVRMETSKGC